MFNIKLNVNETRQENNMENKELIKIGSNNGFRNSFTNNLVSIDTRRFVTGILINILIISKRIYNNAI